MEESDGKLGLARAFALIFGIAYIAVAMVEVILGSNGWVVGGRPITSANQLVLLFEPLHNIIHWVTGVVLLGAFSASEHAARAVARVVGVLFLGGAIIGLAAGDFFMESLGYEGATSVPISYALLQAVTAVCALVAGFAGGHRRPATA